ncbi:MAG TPA: DUF1499 domain-containing protein [Candidatus Binataceae bacterium]|nr:DUF1499 domain-containing protein [Candidatus Binataceae bacterium]
MILIWLALLDGIVGATLAVAGIVAAHYGISTPPAGFQIFLIGVFFAALGLGVSLIAGIASIFSANLRAGFGRLVVGALLALVVTVPSGAMVLTHQYPAINDITTDTKNPPEFTHAQEDPANQGRDMKYSDKLAAMQEAAPAYKDLAALKMNGSVDDVYNRARIIAGEIKDWHLTYNDPATHSIEGVATSMVFKFKDDFVIQVRPADGGGSLIEMRSKSRDSLLDFGANYTRIKRFFQLVQGPPRGAPEQQ